MLSLFFGANKIHLPHPSSKRRGSGKQNLFPLFYKEGWEGSSVPLLKKEG